VTGIILFLGLSLFGNYSSSNDLYMAGLAFTAYGIHWFVIGWNRARGNDPRANLGMAVGFLFISILGMIVFFGASDWAVGGLFTGLTFVYISDIFATVKADLPADIGNLAEKALGFFHLGTGLWLIYLMFSATLHFTLGSGLPL
jgi:hypothetical protein